MTTLHIVRTSAYSDNQLLLCSKVIIENDVVILMDDGCYNLGHLLLSDIADMISMDNLFFIGNHALARSLSTDNFESINMSCLLAKTLSHSNVITWQK